MLVKLSAAMIVVSFVAVCLRFYSRKLLNQPLLWDDWTTLFTLPSAWGVAMINISCMVSVMSCTQTDVTKLKLSGEKRWLRKTHHLVVS